MYTSNVGNIIDIVRITASGTALFVHFYWQIVLFEHCESLLTIADGKDAREPLWNLCGVISKGSDGSKCFRLHVISAQTAVSLSKVVAGSTSHAI